MAGLYEIESIGVDELPRETPKTGQLKPSFPNPFSQTTRIPFDLGQTQPVRVAIYSITGQLIASLAHREMSAGSHEITWDGRDDSGRVVPPGVYFCRIETGLRIETSRIVIVR
jgi:flagellar hook assembly protein FlgD